MGKEQQNSVAKTQDNLPANTPDWMKSDVTGTEHMTADDFTIPRIKIVQAMSGVKEINDNLKDGEFYENLGSSSFGKRLSFHALLFYKSRIWFDSDGKLRGASYLDPVSNDLVTFGSNISDILKNEEAWCKDNQKADKQGPTENHNYFIILTKDLDAAILSGAVPPIYIFSCSSSAIKSARTMNSKFKTNSYNKVPMHAQRVEASTKIEVFKVGKAYMPVFSFVGLNETTQDQYAILTKASEAAAHLIVRADKTIGDDHETPDEVVSEQTNEGQGEGEGF